MSEEMRYRTVNASVRVQSGSESHARWQVFWQLDNQSPVFADDDRQMLEEIITAVACGEQMTEEHIENAAYLLKYPFTQNGYINHGVILSLEVEKETDQPCCVEPVAGSSEPLEHDDDCPVYQTMIDQYKERGGI